MSELFDTLSSPVTRSSASTSASASGGSRRRNVNAGPSVYWHNSPTPNLLNLNRPSTSNQVEQSPLGTQAFRNHILRLSEAESQSTCSATSGKSRHGDGHGDGPSPFGPRKSSGNASPEVISKRNQNSRKSVGDGLMDQIEKASSQAKAKGKASETSQQRDGHHLTMARDQQVESPTKKSRSNPKRSKESHLVERVQEKTRKDGNSSGKSDNRTASSTLSLNRFVSSTSNQDSVNPSDTSFSSTTKTLNPAKDGDRSFASSSSSSHLSSHPNNSNAKRLKRTSSSPNKLRGRLKRSRTSLDSNSSAKSKRNRTRAEEGQDEMEKSGEGEELVMRLLADLNEQLNCLGEVDDLEGDEEVGEGVQAIQDEEREKNELTNSQQVSQEQGKENSSSSRTIPSKGRLSNSQILNRNTDVEKKNNQLTSSQRQFSRTTSLPTSTGKTNAPNFPNPNKLGPHSIIKPDHNNGTPQKSDVKMKASLGKLPLQTMRSENDVFNSSPIRSDGQKAGSKLNIRNNGNGSDSDEFDLSLEMDFEVQEELERLEKVAESQKLTGQSNQIQAEDRGKDEDFTILEVQGDEKQKLEKGDGEKKMEQAKELGGKVEGNVKVKSLDPNAADESYINDPNLISLHQDISTKESPSKAKAKGKVKAHISISNSSNPHDNASSHKASASASASPIKATTSIASQTFAKPVYSTSVRRVNSHKERGAIKSGLNKAFKPPRRVGPAHFQNGKGNPNDRNSSFSGTGTGTGSGSGSMSFENQNGRTISLGSGLGSGWGGSMTGSSSDCTKIIKGPGESIAKPIVLDDDLEAQDLKRPSKNRKSPRLNRNRNHHQVPMQQKSDESFEFDDAVGEEEVEKVFREGGW